ncbi:phosphoadenosine phosphosulfate reductase family protein [Reyranella sp.]|jgi:phosphoadenosine phosphosulfate reductase|uniref:phosphoadenosine phosphosulfate reductase domain-containing protein n=3 Tax=Reyranella sp. TaxID=1929291 RepID=UPI0026C2CA39|nr:phosphoadenosine phosphosulfate reductase family protein [Reyranella sp.]HQS18813.1 phosphoadenosine phosphosulfate reductase family protein [Reyranella sp.]HQT14878.1 phosphoadenosine phosphosulfate reductase family protein [Reyranella sp.]
MKPVKQRYGSSDSKLEFGDCLRACIASVLELPLDDVPHFTWGAMAERHATVREAWGSLRMWLRARNIGLLTYDIPCSTLPEALAWCHLRNPDAHLILGGMGRGGQGHVCVIHKGAIVHEPTPRGDDDGPSLVGPAPDGDWAGKFVALAFEYRPTTPKDNSGLLGVSTQGVEVPPAPDFSILDKHERIGLCFSGGKDSLVVLDLLRPHWHRLCIYRVDTSDLLPETQEVVRHAEEMTAGKVGNWCEITTNARGWQERFGMPSDLVPFDCSTLGRALVNGAAGPIHLAPRMDCCGANLARPLISRMAADGVTLSIRGTRREDPAWGWCATMEATGPDTFIDGATHYWMPIANWTTAEVFAYLQREGLPIARYYQGEYRHSGPECATCTGWWDEGRGKYLRKFHPHIAGEYHYRLSRVQSAIRPTLDQLHDEIADLVAPQEA